MQLGTIRNAMLQTLEEDEPEVKKLENKIKCIKKIMF